ncbi:MAG: PAS domain S-box protein [Smithellaceae bacterium]
MLSGKMHSLLKRQLKRSFGESFEIPDNWSGFIDAVNNAYHESDMDRNMLERSLELSSQELLQANSEMRAIFEAVPDLFLRIDASGKILDCKTASTSDLFVSRQDMIGKKIYDVPITPVANKFRKALKDVMLTNGAVSFEYSLLLHETEHFFEARLIPILEAQTIAFVRNITDRKDAENALKKSEEYYREITMNASDVLFIVDEKGNITYVSPSVERFTGFSPDELIGKNSLFLIIPEDHSKAHMDFAKALMTKEISIPNSFRIRHKNGSEIIMEGVGKNLLHHPVIAGFVMNIRDVTDSRRAEDALRETEKRFRLILDNVQDTVWLMDMNLQITWVSPSVKHKRGFTLEELKNLSIEKHLTPESLRIAVELIKKNLAPERLANPQEDISVKVELEFYRKDGSTMWADTVLTLLRDGQGVPTGILGLARDTTERRNMEEVLRGSEQDFRLLASYHERLNDFSIAFSEAPDSVTLFNSIADSLRLLTGAIASTFSVYHRESRALKLVSLSIDPESKDKISPFFGPELFEMLMPIGSDDLESMRSQGIRRPQDLFELSFGVIPQEISDAVMNAFEYPQIIALAINYAGELVGTCAAYLPGNQPVVPDDALKTFAYLSGMAVKRKQSEDTIRKSEERYRTIFESTATSNIIIAEDTTIIMANNNFASLCGYTKRELEGKMSWTVFIHKDDLEKMKTYHKMRRNGSGSAPSSYEFRLINRQGEVRNIFLNVAVIPETRESIASLIDLTERKQLETQLVQSQKMESVGRLAGGVAHDFNNMLSVIIGNTEMAMKKVRRSEPLYKALQDVLSAGIRSADLTRQLLAFARKQTVSPKVLDLNDTVAGMLKMLQRLIGENIELSWNPGYNLWKVKIDPSQVDQLLANLTVNARDAIEKTGRITIETSNMICDEAYCTDRPEWIPGEYVVLAVSDNGSGMEKETVANIFEPFFTTKKEGQGTGLGLATVYGIVKQNNGFINVYSEPGQGTTFRIYLPRDMDDNTEAIDGEPEMEVRGGTETVLIVEDEETVLKISKAILEVLGYKVLAAGGKDQALQLAREYNENIDLLLIDVVMPDMNGKELSERILAIKPGLKCLFMSGYTADVIARQGVLDKGVKFISKPFNLKDLAVKVREVLGQ